MQRGMRTEDYGLSRRGFRRWLDERKAAGLTPDEALSGQVYHQPWAALLRHWSPLFKFSAKTQESLRRKSKTNAEIKMLFHDWEHEPALMSRPDVRKRVLETQSRALADLAYYGGDANLDAVRFLLESGLYDALADSLGLALR
jgi:hypothetical protein